METTPLQDPFQPSSTPLGDARRYLCWNRVGTIISVDEVRPTDVFSSHVLRSIIPGVVYR